MAFGISFIGEDNFEQDLPGRALLGRITLGAYSESFVSPLGYWEADRYESQWRAAIGALVREGGAVPLVTSIWDPSDSEMLRWWLAYPSGATVFFRESLLLYETLTIPFDADDLPRFVSERRLLTPSGQRISEWAVPLSDVRAFSETWLPGS